MKLIKYFLQKRSVTLLLLLLIFFGGLFAYAKMGKLEDAPFTIKQALVLTPYSGASPSEVQSQVTDVLEEAIQSLGELYYLKTENRAGLSKITVYVKKEIRADEMQQLWDKLRRKVGDVQSKLPAGAGPSVVNDDFGDVLGVFYGLTGEGHTYRELEEQAKQIKNELLKTKDVAKIEIYGVQTPTIDIHISPSIMARSGITPADIARAFEAQNKVVDAGGIEAGLNRIRIESTGNFYSLDDIRNLTIVSRTGEHFRLSDVAEIKESYQTPPANLMRIDGKPAVGIAISTIPTGNVVNMAELIKEQTDHFTNTLPEGFSLTCIYDQGYESAVANQGFIINLIVSVLTVVAILLFFIGFKNGLLIGSGLIFSIFATLIVMFANGIALQRMSLAAIIIAMGMLVDNAIVVSDSALVNMQRGMRKRVAILRACSSTALPLLAATVIAILTFMPIYYSPHITGELLSSLVIVIGVSLMFSWVFALTQTPFFIQEFVRRPRPEELKAELFGGLTEAVIEARFLGPDAAVLDSLTNVAIEIMRKNPKVAHARNEWGNMSMLIRPVYDPVKAGVLGITKTDMMKSVKSINDGLPVGIYRDNEKKVPVLLKSEATQITTAEALGDFAIWNGTQSAPLSQVTKKIETDWEFPVIKTYNRQLSMAAMCGVKPGTTMAEVHGEIRQEIENIQLPAGYSFFWDSQFKDQGEAIQAIVKFFPLAFLLLIVILVALFGNFREPVIILCILPLSLIGVAIGMLLTGFEFGFFPIAGWLGLLGMIIKNVIVLIDEINVQHRQGIDLYTSIIEATVSRTRPVLMAATTTIFGMVPLLFDIAFRGMAATIIFGLTFATLLTLFVTPVLYVLFYKVKEKRV